MRVSSPGKYCLISFFAVFERMTYFEIAVLDSGTRVNILPESKSRSFIFIKSRMPCSEFRATA